MVPQPEGIPLPTSTYSDDLSFSLGPNHLLAGVQGEGEGAGTNPGPLIMAGTPGPDSPRWEPILTKVTVTAVPCTISSRLAEIARRSEPANQRASSLPNSSLEQEGLAEAEERSEYFRPPRPDTPPPPLEQEGLDKDEERSEYFRPPRPDTPQPPCTTKDDNHNRREASLWPQPTTVVPRKEGPYHVLARQLHEVDPEIPWDQAPAPKEQKGINPETPLMETGSSEGVDSPQPESEGDSSRTLEIP